VEVTVTNRARTSVLVLAAALLAACPEPEGEDPTPTPGLQPLCSELAQIPCEDSLVQDLSLHDTISTGSVVTVAEGDDWKTVIDASAGGMNQAANNPFVYVKFDAEAGARKVAISDEDALLTLDWDIAFRRYVGRINSGNSGPGCGTAAHVPGFAYADLNAVPGGLSYETDTYYNGGCTMVDDGSGLDSPDVALTGWWSYGSCVETTLLPFILELSDGHVLKLVVETYYGTGQDTCNSAGDPGGQSGTITLRYQFLE